MVFLTLIFRSLSREPITHSYHKHCCTQSVNKTFVITYALRVVYNPPQDTGGCLPENILLGQSQACLSLATPGGIAVII